MREVLRIEHHLRRSTKTLHASGGVLLLGVQLLELCMMLAFGLRVKALSYTMLLVTAPFAVGLFTRHFQRRLKHNMRARAAYVGMAWVCAFNTLSCSSYAQRDFLPASPVAGSDIVRLCTWLFYAFLALSVYLTAAEVAAGTPRGNGWIFGVVFTYMTLLAPVAMHLAWGTRGLERLYAQVPGVGEAVAYNCIHNSFLSSIAFFLLTMRDSKVLSEAFVDRVGCMLWTFPSIPLTYAAFFRFNGARVANVWFSITSVVAGILITGQKKGWWTSNLKPARREVQRTNG